MAVYKGDAYVEAPGTLSTRNLAIRTVNDDSAPADRASWELKAGESITLYYREFTTGLLPPATPTTLNIIVYYETGTGTLVRTLANAPQANGTSFVFWATDDGTETGAPRAGTLRLYLQAQVGGLGSYNVNTDDDGDQGLLTANIVVDSINPNAYPAGAKFALGPTGNEQVTLTATHTQPFDERGHEEARLDLLDGAAVQASGTSQDVTGPTTAQAFTVNRINFDAGLKNYGARLSPVGNSVLTPTSGPVLWAKCVLGSGPALNQLSLADVVANESAGTLVFTITRTSPDGNTDVTFNTADGMGVPGEAGALAGEDYTAKLSELVQFVGAETSKQVSVNITNNSYPEPDRSMMASISGAVNGSITDGSAEGRIEDDEANFTFLQDVSGNGHDLVAGSVASTSRDCSVRKFGKGRAVAAANSSFLLQDDAFNITGDLCITLVVDLDSLPTIGDRRNLVGFTTVASGTGTNAAYLLSLTNGQFNYNQLSNTTDVIADTETVGLHTYTVRRDDTAKTVVIKRDGVEIGNISYTGAIVSQAGGNLVVLGRADRAGVVQGAGFQLKIWDSLVSQATLDADVISTGKSKPEGTELAFYRMQDI